MDYLLSQEVGRIADGAVEEVIQRYGFTLAENVVENRAAQAKTVKVYLALRKIAEEKSLDILAVKCWPEFPFEQGVSVPGSSLSTTTASSPLVRDAYGAVTMFIQTSWRRARVFNDIIQIDATTTTCCSGTAVPQLLASRHRRQISWSGPMVCRRK